MGGGIVTPAICCRYHSIGLRVCGGDIERSRLGGGGWWVMCIVSVIDVLTMSPSSLEDEGVGEGFHGRVVWSPGMQLLIC